MSEGIPREQAKQWWLQCVACSEASMTTEMRGFGFEEPVYEQALHSFSGGFMNLGHACGLLTGAAMAAGFLARERFEEIEARSTATLHITVELAKAYGELAGSVNCREITDVGLASLSGRLRYLKKGKARMCGRLHLNWSPAAHHVIDNALKEFERHRPARDCANCAVKTMQSLAASTGTKAEDSTLVAGLAGGVGLQGNVCGALAAGAYAMSVAQYREREGGKRDSRIRGSLQELTGASFKGPNTALRLAFVDRFGSELCVQIAQRHFQNIEDHSVFIEQGGCSEMIGFVADWIEGRGVA